MQMGGYYASRLGVGGSIEYVTLGGTFDLLCVDFCLSDGCILPALRLGFESAGRWLAPK